jgi:hypothetical protein
MKKSLLLLMVIFAVNMFAAFYSTEEWELIEETPGHAEMMQYVAETSDGNYVAVGGYSDNGYFDNAFLKKVSSAGTVLWTQTYDDFGQIIYVESTPSGFIFSTAGALHWTNSAGVILSSTPYNFPVSAISKTSNGYILLDNSQSSVGYFRIKRVNELGNPMWFYQEEDTFGQVQDYNYRCIDWDGEHDMDDHGVMIDSGSSITQTADGGFIITGWTYQGDGGGANLYLVKTDSQGEVLWEKGLGEGYIQNGLSVIEDSDGNFVIAGVGGTSNGEKAMMMKTDSSGNLIWNKLYGYGKFHRIIESTSGGYLTVGKYEDWNDQGYLYIVRTDNSGNTDWSDFTYYDGIYGASYHCMEDSGGNYVYCGWSDPDYYHIGTSNTYMAKYSEVEDLEIVVNNILPFEPDWETAYEINLGEDQTMHFEIDAFDPDGTDLTYEWYLNWEMPVSTSPSFDFTLDTEIGEQYSVTLNVNDGFSTRDGERSNLYYEWMINIVESTVTAPQNLTVEITQTDVNLHWDEVIGASKYNIYSSANSETGFTFAGEVTGASTTYWNEPLISEKKFYRVTAE